jgi:NADH dehydrogenase [ubiquinone] 1 alpha subcomplex assembly factor 7
MLKDIIRDRINQHGFITVADYMRLCLLHPQYGYYTTHEPFGAQGDFITAPEISQLFGEVIGIWAAMTRKSQGEPHDFNLVELGPGRGTLMADLLRSVGHIGNFKNSAHIHLIEASPRLQQMQKEKLQGMQTIWSEKIDNSLFDKPVYLVANEFFDALPIRQWVVNKGVWQERVIQIKDDDFIWSAVPVETDLILPDVQGLADGTIYESFPDSNTIFSNLCAGVKKSTGAMVIIDYGDYITPRLGDTLQALKDHNFTDVLLHQGEADLTAHVDFYTLEQIARNKGLKTVFMTQREFLQFYGIDIRLENLLDKADDANQEKLLSGYLRLTDEDEMGRLFKVLLVQS